MSPKAARLNLRNSRNSRNSRPCLRLTRPSSPLSNGNWLTIGHKHNTLVSKFVLYGVLRLFRVKFGSARNSRRTFIHTGVETVGLCKGSKIGMEKSALRPIQNT